MEVAREMTAAQDARRQIPPCTSRLAALDLPGAYAVADLMHRDRLKFGAVQVGRKIGFTNPAMFRHFKNKEELAQSLFEVCYRRLAHGFLQPGASLESVLERGLALI